MLVRLFILNRALLKLHRNHYKTNHAAYTIEIVEYLLGRKKALFITPPSAVYQHEGTIYWKKKYMTYSEYNYLRSGTASFFKKQHFEEVLRLTKDFFHKYNVIDFGCGDGIFIYSLAKCFNSVVGVDVNLGSIEIASKLVSELNLSNVKLICNNKLTIDHIKTNMTENNYHILYLLETLEHTGDNSALYTSKINFLKELFTLLDDGGIIVISVPKMIGISFLVQRFGLMIFDMPRDQISIINLLKTSLLDDTSDLEKLWNGEHLGFNHKKLEVHLMNEFQIVKKKSLLFQVLYVIREPN